MNDKELFAEIHRVIKEKPKDYEVIKVVVGDFLAEQYFKYLERGYFVEKGYFHE